MAVRTWKISSPFERCHLNRPFVIIEIIKPNIQNVYKLLLQLILQQRIDWFKFVISPCSLNCYQISSAITLVPKRGRRITSSAIQFSQGSCVPLSVPTTSVLGHSYGLPTKVRQLTSYPWMVIADSLWMLSSLFRSHPTSAVLLSTNTSIRKGTLSRSPFRLGT